MYNTPQSPFFKGGSKCLDVILQLNVAFSFNKSTLLDKDIEKIEGFEAGAHK